jgi:flagellar basal body-associated protein FliL
MKIMAKKTKSKKKNMSLWLSKMVLAHHFCIVCLFTQVTHTSKLAQQTQSTTPPPPPPTNEKRRENTRREE